MEKAPAREISKKMIEDKGCARTLKQSGETPERVVKRHLLLAAVVGLKG